MKIKTKSYGLFYKDNGSWRGPVNVELLTKKQILEIGDDYKKGVEKQLKKKTKIFKQIWKSV